MYSTLKLIGKRFLPHNFILKNEGMLRGIVASFYKGDKHQCNICHYKLKSFIEYENGERSCPNCGSLRRTRRLYWLLQNEKLTEGLDVLHFSPPKIISSRLQKSLGNGYITTDFENQFKADKNYDITNLSLQSNQLDSIICYHVLEHIVDDIQAMKELYRVIKPGGFVLIQTPYRVGKIFEQANIITKEERKKHFGQEDHVRIYSVAGLKTRLESVNFEVQVLEFNENQDHIYGFKLQEWVLKASKPA